MSRHESGAVDVTAAFLLGALFGAGIALLLAPQSGEDLRKDVRKKGKRVRKDAGKQFDKASERIRETSEEWLEEAENRIGDLTHEIADAVEEGVQTIRETVADEIKGLEKKLGKKKGFFG